MVDEVRTIPLTQGQVTIVDAEWYEMLSSVKWYARASKGTFYVKRRDELIEFYYGCGIASCDWGCVPQGVDR